jgi:protein-tyrosine phosphatase
MEVHLTSKTKICFVCLGNIVRSPLAEKMFAHLAGEAGVGHKYEIDSAGTGAWHIGERPDPRMRRVAARNGLNYDGRARQFELEDFDRFDLIIVMDGENRRDLLELAPSEDVLGKIHALREFDPQGDPRAAVPDPYYGGWQGFEETYEIVRRSVEGLLESLEDGHLQGRKG